MKTYVIARNIARARDFSEKEFLTGTINRRFFFCEVTDDAQKAKHYKTAAAAQAYIDKYANAGMGITSDNVRIEECAA